MVPGEARDAGEDKVGHIFPYQIQFVALHLRQLSRRPFTSRSYRGFARTLHFAASFYLGKQARARARARLTDALK